LFELPPTLAGKVRDIGMLLRYQLVLQIIELLMPPDVSFSLLLYGLTFGAQGSVERLSLAVW
jgi:hypothetical protein